MKSVLQIAVADDEADMRDFLKLVLERVGHQVLGPVDDGAKLVDLCRHRKPDLVITDICMPGLNGDDAVRQIRSFHPVPCLVVSAYDDSARLALCAGGRCAFLAKPFRKNDLYDAIASLMMS